MFGRFFLNVIVFKLKSSKSDWYEKKKIYKTIYLMKIFYDNIKYETMF